MHLNLLRTFLVVAKHRNISRASEELFLTQPAVTKQIKALEERYERVLFNRGHKELTLTEAGKAIVNYATRILDLVEESLESVKEGGDIKGNLRILSNYTLGVYIIPKIVGFFRNVYPQITVEAYLDNTDHVIRMIRGGEASFGFTGKNLKEPMIVSNVFYQDKLVVVIGKNYDKKGKTVSWRNLLEIPFIGRERGSDIREAYETILQDKGIKIAPAIELNSTEAIKQALQAGLGFSILPWCSVEYEVRADLMTVLSLPYFDPIQYYYICHYANKQFSQVEKIFLSAIFNRLSLGPTTVPEAFKGVF